LSTKRVKNTSDSKNGSNIDMHLLPQQDQADHQIICLSIILFTLKAQHWLYLYICNYGTLQGKQLTTNSCI